MITWREACPGWLKKSCRQPRGNAADAGSWKDKARTLDEFIAVSGHHRKRGIRLLRQSGEGESPLLEAGGRRTCDEVDREASGRICGKRLKVALPHPAESMECHDHLGLDPGVRERLLAASAAAPDRLLKPVRAAAASRRSLNRGRRIPVRTFADWDRPPPGFLETGLAATGVCAGWAEAAPLLAREQSLAVAGLEAIAGQLPFPVLGIGSDNDTVFINDTLTECCAQRGNQFTRSRACRKNDQARVELKNGAVVRRFLGRERYSGQAAGQP